MPLHFKQDPLPLENPGERHVPAVLLVDTSSSMGNGAIDELNKGLVEFGNALQGDSLVLSRVEVCIISFNSSVQTEVGFRPAVQYEPPTLEASGLTAMNEAIEVALDALETRKELYRANGVKYYRPWLFLLTDGAPTDTTRAATAKARLQQAIESRKLNFLPIAVGCADENLLKSYYPEKHPSKQVCRLSGELFSDIFFWPVPFAGYRSVPDGAYELSDIPPNISIGI